MAKVKSRPQPGPEAPSPDTDHAIYLHSSEAMDELLNDSVHLTVTSPPYISTLFHEGQEFDYEGFLDHYRTVVREVYRVTVPGGRYALNVGDIVTKYRYPKLGTLLRVPLGPDLLQISIDAGFVLLERFIWDKGYTRNMGGPLLGSFPYPLTVYNNVYFENIYVFAKPGKRRVRQELRERSRYTLDEWRLWSQQWWRIESISEKFKHHPAVFPLEIPRRMIRMFSYLGDTILDPYMGTGATMLAAHLCGRRSVGYEIDAKVEALVRQRIEFEQKRGTAIEGLKFRLVNGRCGR
jgi:site-specific DNA-methyltransferase (adenine-specific)